MNRFYTPELMNNCIFNQKINQHMFSSPKTNIIEHENEIIVELAIPGFQKEQIEILIENESLFVIGKPEFSDSDSTQYLSKEFSTEPFRKGYKISPKMNLEETQARMQNGILTLTIPKRIEQKIKNTKQIEIN